MRFVRLICGGAVCGLLSACVPAAHSPIFDLPDSQPTISDEAQAPAELLQKLGVGAPAPVASLPKPTLEVNAEVRRELRLLVRRDAASVRIARANAHHDLEIMTRIFQDEGIPKDLLNLAFIESGLRNNAVSPNGAVGMWQFTASTARLYGLRVSKKEDQRRDLVRATLAAARHLKDLYGMFGDWYLVLAAYNAGPRSIPGGNDVTFWDLSRRGKLSRETTRFVPRFIATTIVAQVLERYGATDVEHKVELHLARMQNPSGLDIVAFNIDSAGHSG